VSRSERVESSERGILQDSGEANTQLNRSRDDSPAAMSALVDVLSASDPESGSASSPPGHCTAAAERGPDVTSLLRFKAPEKVQEMQDMAAHYSLVG
jgi:hypothetical protein